MKTVLGLALLAVLSLAHAASSTDSLLLAQAQKKGQKPSQTQSQTQSQQKRLVCDKDGNAVGDRETWCRRGSVHQCNAATGQWINMGKKCP